MRTSLLGLLLLTCPWLAAQTGGQSQPYRYRGNGYVFGALGACQHGYFLGGGGGGGEALVWKGLAVGGEAGAYSFSDGWAFGSAQATLGWHFVDRNVRDKTEYFVNFGPGIAFGLGGSSASPWASLGGGGIAWINDRVGIRFEVRSQAMSEEGMIVGRIGVSFR